MAIIDDKTGGREYPLPNAANKLKDDVVRLRAQGAAVDSDVTNLLLAMALKADATHSHVINDVTGLQGVLDGKQPVGTYGALDDLSDVSVTGATNGQVLIKQGASWIPIALQVGNITNLETLLDGKASTASVAAKADATATTNALALKAPLASPALTGTPTAPTAAPDTNTTQVATTGFLAAAIAALKGGVDAAYDTLAKLATAVLGRALKIDTTPNLFVNGSVIDSQERGTTLGTTNGYFAADQFGMYISASGAAVSVQNIALDNDDGGDRAIELKVTTAKASLGDSDFWTLTQNIEGFRPQFKAAKFGTAGAKPFVLRKRFWAPAAGTYGWHFQNQDGTRHCWVPFTISGGEAGTMVEKVITVPPCTDGTWLKGEGQTGLICDLVLAAGATLVGGTAGVWGTSAFYAGAGQKNCLDALNTVRASEFGLRLDPDATGVYGAYEFLTDAEYRSERYSYRMLPSWRGAVDASANVERAGGLHPVRMAKTPVITMTGTVTFSDGVGSANPLSVGTNFSTRDVAEVSFPVSTGLTIGRPASLVQAGAGSFFVNARLS